MVKLNHAKKFTEFAELKRGDTFLHGDYVYIKTEKFVVDQDGVYNAVCITDGDFGCFHPQDKVVAIDIEATIR